MKHYTKPKIVLIGAGKFGSNHFRNLIILNRKNKVEFIGVVDVDKKVLSSIEKKYSISTSTNYKEFIKDADAFDIVTSASTHFKLAKIFLTNSKHVFVEKPLALNSKQAEYLVNLAKRKRKILQVGHIFRYNYAVEIIKKRIQKKERFPYYITGNFLQPTKPKNDVGAIFNYLHHFDILDNILGLYPLSVFAISNLNLLKPKREVNAQVFLQFSKNLNVFLNLGWIAGDKYRTLDLYSKKEHISCNLGIQLINIYENGKLKKKMMPKHEESLKLELIDFVSSINTNRKPKADGIIGSRIVKIAEAATKSLKMGKTIKLSN